MTHQSRPADVPTIIVVDDSETVLRVVNVVLAGAGYHVIALGRGDKALETARDAEPDLILLDLAMPGWNGYDVCQALGRDPATQHVPVVIMSTKGDTVGERFVEEMGVVDHISKPFAPEALLAVVQHTLRKAHTGLASQRRRAAHAPAERAAPAQLQQSLASEVARDLDVSAEQAGAIIEKLCRSPQRAHRLQHLLHLYRGAPPLSGRLESVGLAEVLQLLAMQRQSGFLRVSRGSRRISIAFKNGAVRLVIGEQVDEEFLLGRILVREGLMQPGELDLLLNNRRGTRRRLGRQVVELGYVTPEQLHQALRRQSSELVYELLRWGGGYFAFEPHETLPEEVLEFEFGLTIDELLMEGFRRVDEWGLIESALPSFDLIPSRVPGGEQHAGPDGLTDAEQQVLEHVDGAKSARQIIEDVNWGTFEVARVLYRLLAARIITVPFASGMVDDPVELEEDTLP